MEMAAMLLLAISLDLLFCEPPTALHPVGWLGRLIGALESRCPGRSPAVQLLYGAGMVAFVVILAGGLCYSLLSLLAGWHRLAYIVVGALILKSTFAVRELSRAAGRVKVCLQDDDLAGARRELRALVSRDTSGLGSTHLAAAAVESVAENTVDSFVSPIFYFLLLAPLGAWAPVGALTYRVVNTFDSMVGYRGHYEFLGKAAARCDDLLNFLPARLGALCMVACAAWLGDARGAWTTMCRDHGLTESPNAGWTMSAAAGALNVRLEKLGHYCLGNGDQPSSHAIDTVCRLGMATTLFFTALGIVKLLLFS